MSPDADADMPPLCLVIDLCSNIVKGVTSVFAWNYGFALLSSRFATCLGCRMPKRIALTMAYTFATMKRGEIFSTPSHMPLSEQIRIYGTVVTEWKNVRYVEKEDAHHLSAHSFFRGQLQTFDSSRLTDTVIDFDYDWTSGHTAYGYEIINMFILRRAYLHELRYVYHFLVMTIGRLPARLVFFWLLRRDREFFYSYVPDAIVDPVSIHQPVELDPLREYVLLTSSALRSRRRLRDRQLISEGKRALSTSHVTGFYWLVTNGSEASYEGGRVAFNSAWNRMSGY